jgi:hypothetical protein
MKGLAGGNTPKTGRQDDDMSTGVMCVRCNAATFASLTPLR